MSDNKRYDEIQRGDMAKTVMSNPVFTEALDQIEKDILSAWEGTNPRDTEAREKAWAFYVASKKIRATLQSYIETGHMAVMQLEEKRRFNVFRSN